MYAKNTVFGRLGVDFLVDALSLGLVVAIAAFLRFYRLSELPPGLHQDEAIYAPNSAKPKPKVMYY